MPRPTAPLFPLFLDVRAVPVLVIGGGEVAFRKAATLIECGARVTVVAPACDPRLLQLCRGLGGSLAKLRLIKRKYRPADIKKYRLVFSATNDADLNEQICKAAKASGAWANCAAPPEAGNCAVPASVRRGAFCIAVSTFGASAALAAHWRKRLEKIAGAEWGELIELLNRKRSAVKAARVNSTVRRAILLALGKAHWAAKIKKLGVKEVERRMDALIQKNLHIKEEPPSR